MKKAKAKAARAKEAAVVATMAAENMQSMAANNELSGEFIYWGESEFNNVFGRICMQNLR